jgi:hypothetical protein
MPNHDDVNKIVNRFNNLVQNAKNTQQSYIELAHRYLELKQLQQPLFGKGFYEDIDQYEELVFFCLVIQDPYFLNIWGNPSRGTKLAESVNTYIDYFNYILQIPNVPVQIKNYLSYLVETILRSD